MLVRAPGLGPIRAAGLLAQFGAPGAVRAAGRSELTARGVPEAAAEFLLHPDADRIEADLAWARQPGNHVVPLTSPDYPDLLREIAAAPVVLFVRGEPDVLGLPQLAVVGSRNPTPAGRETAHEFAAFLARAGLVITSGLALGIDAASHRGALAAAGTTIAVCGTGTDRVYPSRHRDLAHEIATHGALVSEFPPGTPARREHFPQRNRILSGLTLGTLVVEAAERSGSLITARLAGEQGREVFAIPGSIHSPLSRGCHRLIRQGAKLVESGTDVLEELPALIGALTSASPENVSGALSGGGPQPLDPEYERLLNAMEGAPVAVDQLVARTGLTPEQVSSMLLILELEGLVASAPGGSFGRVRQRT